VYSLSPNQLFTAGLLHLQRLQSVALDFFNNVSEDLTMALLKKVLLQPQTKMELKYRKYNSTVR